MSLKGIYEVQGMGVVLSQVQNIYPVEKDKIMFCWGFKYVSGMWEYFYYKGKKEAALERKKFMEAIDNFLALGRH